MQEEDEDGGDDATGRCEGSRGARGGCWDRRNCSWRWELLDSVLFCGVRL